MDLIRGTSKYFSFFFLFIFMTISSYAEEQKLTFKYENSISNEYFFFVITKNDKNCILSIEGEKRNELELCPKDNELSLILE